jgi:hypothetical protein
VSWDRPKAAHALAQVLEAALPEVSVFDHPPPTMNPPALVVQLPTTVVPSSPTFGTDTATWTVLAAVGADQADGLDDLLRSASAAIKLNPRLDGATQLTRVTEWRDWRLMAVAGAELMVAHLVLETRM